MFRRSHVRDVAMKRLRFIDDYCRVKETSLSTRLPCGSREHSTPLHKPVKSHMVKAHSVFSHALNMGLETALGERGDPVVHQPPLGTNFKLHYFKVSRASNLIPSFHTLTVSQPSRKELRGTSSFIKDWRYHFLPSLISLIIN